MPTPRSAISSSKSTNASASTLRWGISPRLNARLTGGSYIHRLNLFRPKICPIDWICSLGVRQGQFFPTHDLDRDTHSQASPFKKKSVHATDRTDCKTVGPVAAMPVARASRKTRQRMSRSPLFFFLKGYSPPPVPLPSTGSASVADTCVVHQSSSSLRWSRFSPR